MDQNNDTPEQPDEAPAIPVQTLKPVKKSNRKLILWISVPLALILIATGVVLILSLNHKPAPAYNQQASTNDQPKTSEKLAFTDAKSLVELIKTRLSSNYKTTYPSLNFTADNRAPAYNPSGYGYYVAGGDFGGSYNIMRNAVNDGPGSDADFAFSTAILKSINQYLSDYGFDGLQSATIVCSVSGADSYPAQLACANKSDYKKDAEALAPFAKAYFSANPDQVKANPTTVFSPPAIKNSKTAGYQIAAISISEINGVGGFSGSFYSVNGTWSYFKGTQSYIPCTAYETVDQKTAYEGEICWDTATDTQSVVVK